MTDPGAQLINGKFLYYAFLSGSHEILRKQSELNDINVFPVVDKDTGTNLASTMRSVIDNIRPEKSYKKTVDKIADAALVGARGNSGVIFAQFLHGVSQETSDKASITLHDFINSIRQSIPYIYGAVANPREGTILTVIREWSEFLASRSASLQNMRNLLIESREVLHHSLKQTTSRLGELNKYGFVDAGAKGFVHFVEGIIEFTRNRNVRHLLAENPGTISLVHSEDMMDEEIRFRYCTEALLSDITSGPEQIRKLLEDYGDSVVLAGSATKSRIHLHTNKPAELFHDLRKFANITYQKVDDMVQQHNAALHRKWNIALVTDSTCDLDPAILDHYQVTVAPINLNFGVNQYLDKVTIQPEQFYELLEESPEFPSTSQVNENTFTNIYSHLASHYDAIISIHLSSRLSGTFESSVKASKRIEKEFGKPVHVFDSRNLSGGLGLILLKAAQAIEAGESFEEITGKLESWRASTRIFVSVKNLKYMIKGGRVSKPRGMVANLLGLNPMITLDEEGKSALFGKTFSQRASLEKIFRTVEALGKERQTWNYTVLHAHNPAGARKVADRMRKLTGLDPVSVVNIAPVIGMHAGLGALSVALLAE